MEHTRERKGTRCYCRFQTTTLKTNKQSDRANSKVRTQHWRAHTYIYVTSFRPKNLVRNPILLLSHVVGPKHVIRPPMFILELLQIKPEGPSAATVAHTIITGPSSFPRVIYETEKKKKKLVCSVRKKKN